MILFFRPRQSFAGTGAFLSALLAVVVPASVLAQPAQKPLLAVSSGAKPNLMIALDNSGSMAYPHHESYGIILNTDAATALLQCAPPLYSNSPTGYILGGTVDPSRPAGNRCLTATGLDAAGNPTGYAASANNGTAYFPAVTATNSVLAQRSADLNPVYYNPRTTYAPRIGPDYQPLTRPATPTFISNAASSTVANAFYQVYRNPADGALYTVHVQKPAPAPRPAWATPIDNLTSNSGNRVYGLRTYAFPVHAEINNAGNNLTPAFTYTFCRDAAGNSTVQQTPEGMDVGCSSVRRTPFSTSAAGSVVSVFAPGHPSAATNVITLPTDHKRTDCAAADSCTNAEEINNILNWYHWYSTRQLATSTAIGQSLAAPSFQGQLRVGYMPINDFELPGTGNVAIATTPGTVNRPTVLRGVRNLEASSPTSPASANTQLYSWLNNMVSRGGTPLHNAVTRIADYYAVTTGVTDSPWSTDPSRPVTHTLPDGSTNVEKSCRRSFNLLFSDGAWTNGTGYIPATAGPDYDNTDGPSFSRVNASGSTETFNYQRTGDNTTEGRKLYTPYPSSGTGGLADLTAGYFWHTDLRTSLANDIQTRPGQPAFWQNMATYTVGYMIQPTGEATGGAGLTFGRIDQYQAQYATSGYAAATKPDWPLGNLRSSPTQARVDDFIQAGYTGGGRSFSATTSDDVRRIFDTIVSEILNSAGNDAGVAVSGANTGSNTSTLQGRVKYSVTYRTMDNSGDIEAEELNEDGSVNRVLWTASSQMPSHDNRNVFSIATDNTAFEFEGRFDALPADIQAALNTGADNARIPTGDSRFVDYLRGKDPVTDVNSKLFRQRSTPLAAMVNPPSIYMGGNVDQIYDLVGTVQGSADYKAYMKQKRDFPASLYVATNAGVMHALDASTGEEMAGFMPRRSMRRLLNYANAAYEFEYVLDGPISEHDLYIKDPTTTDPTPSWQHMAIGTGGRGEQLVYAVRAPLHGTTSDGSANRTPEAKDFAWENGPENINDAEVHMGYITTPARSGQTIGGDWVVILPSGHYNGVTDDKKHGLIVLDATTGKLLKNIPLPDSAQTGRGLGGITLIRVNQRIVGAYAGDANGNLWRFDLRGTKAQWKVAYEGAPIFKTTDSRPIYGAPAWQEHEEGGTIVVVATGILLEESDIGDTAQKESIYGIWDPTPVGEDDVTFTTREASKLQTQTVQLSTSTVFGSGEYYEISNNPLDWDVHHGWKLELGYRDVGERNLDQIQNFGAVVFLTTSAIAAPAVTEEEVCKASDLPVNYLYLLDAQTGSLSKNRTSFDIKDKDGASGTDGKGDGFVVGRMASGGYSRSVVLPPTFKTPEPPPGCTGAACIVDIPDEIRPYLDGRGPQGEDTPDPPCGTIGGGGAQGSADEPSAGFGDNCPKSKAWSRTQIQLSAPAAK